MQLYPAIKGGTYELSSLLADFASAHGLPLMSADELIFEAETPEQVNWLSAINTALEIAEYRESFAHHCAVGRVTAFWNRGVAQ